ncbi:hypothetical protein GWI33_010626 [Rhynchophorus ferrugineus]|uniref:Uncharacterized protein n=1 Tax=Rhynchophorus ferrugineus TaxID=354439 RepID=A0A834IS15_RHYFE|nr:hypothetical protein GWI33_010626 [Rhynchophorus ferrugineus]
MRAMPVGPSAGVRGVDILTEFGGAPRTEKSNEKKRSPERQKTATWPRPRVASERFMPNRHATPRANQTASPKRSRSCSIPVSVSPNSPPRPTSRTVVSCRESRGRRRRVRASGKVSSAGIQIWTVVGMGVDRTARFGKLSRIRGQGCAFAATIYC